MGSANWRLLDPSQFDLNKAFAVGTDVTAGTATECRELSPEYNGRRVKAPDSAAVYLVDAGKLRHIPNMQVYQRLFAGPEGIWVTDLRAFEVGQSLGDNTMLLLDQDRQAVFLYDGIDKRHVPNPDIAAVYGFDFTKLRAVPGAVLSHIPTGAPLQGPVTPARPDHPGPE